MKARSGFLKTGLAILIWLGATLPGAAFEPQGFVDMPSGTTNQQTINVSSDAVQTSASAEPRLMGRIQGVDNAEYGTFVAEFPSVEGLHARQSVVFERHGQAIGDGVIVQVRSGRAIVFPRSGDVPMVGDDVVVFMGGSPTEPNAMAPDQPQAYSQARIGWDEGFSYPYGGVPVYGPSYYYGAYPYWYAPYYYSPFAYAPWWGYGYPFSLGFYFGGGSYWHPGYCGYGGWGGYGWGGNGWHNHPGYGPYSHPGYGGTSSAYPFNGANMPHYGYPHNGPGRPVPNHGMSSHGGYTHGGGFSHGGGGFSHGGGGFSHGGGGGHGGGHR
jgi:hypothetical protein